MLLSWIRQAGGRMFAKDRDDKFPSRQLFVLALCRICEPIAFMSIFPYVYYMVSSFHLTEDNRKIALYAGAVTSAFTFAEFSMGVFWGRMSDNVGRKPVLIMGLVGTAISMVAFGFASSLPVALIARALGGMLNGNIGVLQTTVAELVKNKEHQPRAYSIMPFVWCLGSIIGPAMGGALAMPCDSYPQFFSRGTVFDRYPFLLPNLVCVTVLIVGIVIGILFLEETHPELKFKRDRGLQCGRWLIGRFSGSSTELPRDSKSHMLDGASQFLCDSQSPSGYNSTESSPRLSSVKGPSPGDKVPQLPGQKQTRGFTTAFTRNVIFIILSYGILAYHSVSFDQLMPIFLSTPVSKEKAQLPFKFTGGLALSTKEVGFMLAVQGIYSMFAQLWLFPLVVRLFGTLRAYRFVLVVWPVLYVIVPYLILLPEKVQIPAIYAALISKITVHVIAFPSTNILLANSAPSTMVLGSINGVAASTASLARGFGPTITGYLHSKGLEWGYSGLAWWACGLVCVLGAIQSFWLKDETNDTGKTEKADVGDCEVGACDDSMQTLLSRTSSAAELVTLSQSPISINVQPSRNSLDDIADFNLDDDVADSQQSSITAKRT